MSQEYRNDPPPGPQGTETSESTQAPAPAKACRHDGCSCQVTSDYWCSEACMNAQQGYGDAMSGGCPCGHADCSGAHSLASTTVVA